jgi:leucyl/phenylalanyl-tRNA--protein transferase
MPVFLLGEDCHFPPARLASSDGVIAVGGDLSPRRLIRAYAAGIFPWFSENGPIIWWSPDPRLVLFPEEVHVSKSMRRVLNQDQFRCTLDLNFSEVLGHCRQSRKGESGTWITDEMAEAYLRLHRLGYAHSVEVWSERHLVGGLYGVSLGSCFFAESKYYQVTNASKFAFIWLARFLKGLGFLMMDCQVTSDHVKSMGAREGPRREFLSDLAKAMRKPTLRGSWEQFLNRTQRPQSPPDPHDPRK